MSITNTDIMVEQPEPDGRRRGRARFHFSEGKMVEFDFNMRPAGTDFAVLAAAKVPEIEAQEKDSELRRIYQAVIDGADYATERDAMLFNSVDELETFILKKTANIRFTDNQSIQEGVHKVIAFEIVFQASPSRIGGLMGLSTGDVVDFKGDVQALLVAVTGYAPTIPTYPEVEE